MPVPRIAILVLPILLSVCSALQADTVILKSGEKVEGKILSETPAEVTVSVQITATIKDERSIKRDDIAKIEKVLPDEEAWASLSNLAPGNESLERDEYDRVKTALAYFTSTFPKSPHAAQAKTRLDQFTAEQVRVGMGEVKLNGQWLGKEKVQEERIQIAGHILLNRMKRAAGSGQLTDAMAIFDQLEKGFGGSASYPEAVELGRRILASLWPIVEQKQTQLKLRMEDEKKRLAASKGAELAQLDAIIKKEVASTEAAIAALDRAGAKWLPLHPANTRSLSALASRVTSETSRLNGLDIEKMRDSVKASETAANALNFGNLDGAEKALREATSAWSANELAKRLQGKLTEAKKAPSAPKSGSATPPPASAPKPKLATASAPTPAPNASPTPEAPGETSIFKRPVFFIVLAVIVSFGAVAGKMLAKSRAAAGTASGD